VAIRTKFRTPFLGIKPRPSSPYSVTLYQRTYGVLIPIQCPSDSKKHQLDTSICNKMRIFSHSCYFQISITVLYTVPRTGVGKIRPAKKKKTI